MSSVQLDVGAQTPSWTRAAQALGQMISSNALQQHADQLRSICSMIIGLPHCGTFPFPDKQQKAYDQLLLLLPQLVGKWLDQNARSQGWQHSTSAFTLISMLRALKHMADDAGINHAVDPDSMPLLPSLARHWQQLGVLPKLAAAMRDMQQLLLQHKQQQEQLTHQLMGLSYGLLNAWLYADTVANWGNACKLAEASAAAQAAAALTAAAAQVMPLDTPPVCFSQLLSVSISLLHHQLFTLTPEAEAARLCQNPHMLWVILFVLTLQAAGMVAQSSTADNNSDSSSAAAGSTGPQQSAATEHQHQQQLQALRSALQSLWQQLEMRPELLPTFEAAMVPKYDVEFTAIIPGLVVNGNAQTVTMSGEHIGQCHPAQMWSKVVTAHGVQWVESICWCAWSYVA